MVCTIGVGCVLSMNCKEEEKASSKNENDNEGKHVAIDIHGNLEEKDLQKVTCKSIEKNFMEDGVGPESVPLITSETPSVAGNDSSITENYTSTSTILCENPYKLPNPLIKFFFQRDLSILVLIMICKCRRMAVILHFK